MSRDNVRQALIVFLLAMSSHLFAAEVTYRFSGGRLGDNLVAYLHDKWLSFKYNLPLRYVPFTYSDLLVLHDSEPYNDKSIPKILVGKNNFAIDPTKRVLYIIPYFSEFIFEHKINTQWIYFAVDWKNPEFKTLIKKMIAPKNNNLLSWEPPKDRITVAVHMRKGGGFDDVLLADALVIDKPLDHYGDYKEILKFPPEQFYIDQLRYVSEYFGNVSLYVYIFTDDRNPAAIVERLKKNLPEYHNLEFHYRESDNKHDKNVLEDFFALTKFDCLIRPQSNFSLAAAKISDYKLEISPVKGHWDGTRPSIDEIEIQRGDA
jgi:hypothetical protein